MGKRRSATPILGGRRVENACNQRLTLLCCSVFAVLLRTFALAHELDAVARGDPLALQHLDLRPRAAAPASAARGRRRRGAAGRGPRRSRSRSRSGRSWRPAATAPAPCRSAVDLIGTRWRDWTMRSAVARSRPFDRGDQHLARGGVDVDQGRLGQDDDIGLSVSTAPGSIPSQASCAAERGMSGGLAGAPAWPRPRWRRSRSGRAARGGEASRRPAAMRVATSTERPTVSQRRCSAASSSRIDLAALDHVGQVVASVGIGDRAREEGVRRILGVVLVGGEEGRQPRLGQRHRPGLAEVVGAAGLACPRAGSAGPSRARPRAPRPTGCAPAPPPRPGSPAIAARPSSWRGSRPGRR